MDIVGIGRLEMFILVIFGIILAYILLWVYRDAGKRYPKGSYKPMLWVLVVIFMHLIGLVLYILLRPEITTKQELRMTRSESQQN